MDHHIQAQQQQQQHIDQHQLHLTQEHNHHQEHQQKLNESPYIQATTLPSMDNYNQIKLEDNNDINSAVPMVTEHTNDTVDSRAQPHDEMMQQLMILVQRTQDTDVLVQSSRNQYQEFVITLQTRSRIMSSINYIECNPQITGLDLEKSRRDLQSIESVIRQRAASLNNTRRQLIRSHSEIFDRLMELQNAIIYEYLPNWHREQQLVNNGFQIETIKLDKIQSWVE